MPKHTPVIFRYTRFHFRLLLQSTSHCNVSSFIYLYLQRNRWSNRLSYIGARCGRRKRKRPLARNRSIVGHRNRHRKNHSKILENSVLSLAASTNDQARSNEKGNSNDFAQQNSNDICIECFRSFLCLQDRLVANEFLQCRKVCEHVLDKILGAESGVSAMSSNASQSNQNDNSSEGSQVAPEDKIELFCNNVVCIR